MEAGSTFEGGIRSHAVGALRADETAFTAPGTLPTLAIADGVVCDGDGPLASVTDDWRPSKARPAAERVAMGRRR